MDPLTLRVAGRGKLRARAEADDAGVTIRLDDDRNDEFWAEVRLSEEQLVALLAEVRATQQRGDDDIPEAELI